MGKKEPSKGREWERGRRDVLNQTFQKLREALPNYPRDVTLSKKTILTEALAYIHRLEREKQEQCGTNHDLLELQTWVRDILQRQAQLLGLLRNTGISLPANLVALQHPPKWVEKFSPTLFGQIQKQGEVQIGDKKKNCSKKVSKKRRVVEKTKENHVSHKNSVNSTSCSFIPSKSTAKAQDQEDDSSCKKDTVPSTCVPLVQSGPVMVRTSPLQLPPQLLFTSGTSNSSLSTSLPLLVSVAGVKPVNPVILVQSSGIASSPLTPQNAQNTFVNTSAARAARPIRPGLQTKTPGKVKKIAIPSLRSRTISSVINNDCKMKFKKRIKLMSITPKKNSKNQNTVEQCKSSEAREDSMKKIETASDGISCCQNFKTLCQSRENSLHLSSTSNSKAAGVVCAIPGQKMVNIDQSCSDIKNTETVELQVPIANQLSGENGETGTSLSRSGSSDAASKEIETSCPLLNTNSVEQGEKSSVPTHECAGGSVLSKRLAASDVTDSGAPAKRTKTNTDRRISEIRHDKERTSNDNTSQACEDTSTASPSKASKSNYSILALCSHQQQLYQHSHLLEQRSQAVQNKSHSQHQEIQESGQQNGSGNIQEHQLGSIQPQHLENIQQHQQENMLQQQSGNVQQQGNVQQEQEGNAEQQQEHGQQQQDQRAGQGLVVTSEVQHVDKVPDISLPSTEQFLEWTEKSRMKSDRSFPSYSPFPTSMVHNSKNTFVPINDMDGYKTMPEVFDSAEGSFSLPLHSSDISGDIFASLQVPSGGQHPESISPTAAFLLAFPLVSTSKASELLTDEAVCENSDSQPGMKTILQIGNLDSDTPVTKCVSVFSNTVIDNNSAVFSGPHDFPQDRSAALTSKGKHVSSNSSENIDSFIEKNDDILILHNKTTEVVHKGGPNFTDKSSVRHYPSKGEVDIDPNKDLPATFTSKSSHQSQNSNENKSLQCQSRNPSHPTMMELHPSLQGGNGETKDKAIGKSHTVSCVTMSATTATSKASVATSVGSCDKRSVWPSVLNTTQVIQNPFSDFPTSNSSQSDCVLNLPALPMLATSSNPIEKCAQSSNNVSAPVSSCASIVSWSTLPPVDSSHTVKSGVKLAHFETSDKSSLLPSMSHYSYLPSPSSTGTSQHSVVYSGEGKAVMSTSNTQNALTASKLAMNYVNHKAPEHKHSAVSGQFNPSTKLNMPMTHYSASGKSADSKKHFDNTNEIKQNSVNQEFTQPLQTTKQIVPTPSVQHYSNRSSELKNIVNQTSSPSSSSSSSMYGHRASSEGKHKSGSLNYSHSLTGEPKQGTCLPIYNQSVHLAGKLYNQGAAVNQKASYSVKQIVPQNPSMNLYSHGSSMEGKVPNSSVHYSQTTQTVSESKKTPQQCSQNQGSGASHTAGKENAVLSHYAANSVPVPQYNLSSTDALGHQHKHHEQPHTLQHTQQSQDHHHHHLHHQQQSQQQEQLQENQFLQTNSKEPTTNLHRPPVNWMTAPDIRSHQHHNGPAFGNSGSGVCSTQGMLYLSDHMKDGETGPSTSIFDSAGNFHCLEMTHSGQAIYKSNELQIFGSDAMETLNENNSWSPNKGSNSSVLANMLIPSTLPTLVGDLALGDNNLSRPFLPSLTNDHSCPKKSMKRSSHTSKRAEKVTEEVAGAQNVESSGSFLSVSQLVDSNSSKNRGSTSLKESGSCYPAPYSEQDSSLCQPNSKHNTPKPVSSNYSTEALLSTSSVQQNTQHSFRKRRTPASVHYANNYVATGAVPDLASFHSSSSSAAQTQAPQTQCSFLSSEYQGTFLHSDAVPPFVLTAPARSSHRNVAYAQNVIDRNSNEENLGSRRTLPSAADEQSNTNQVRQRTASGSASNAASSNSIVPASSNIMDFGYINMTPSMLTEDLNFTNHHPPPPPFLPHHSYSVTTPQDALYSAPRLAMHPHHTHHQNSNVHSPSATTLTNFHLSTIFPEINDKVLC